MPRSGTSLLDNRLRERLHRRMAKLDFSANKLKVVGLMLSLLQQEQAGAAQAQGATEDRP